MEKIENKEMCKICGGYCCKKSGCDYAPSDFKALGVNDLAKILESGNISIVAALKFSFAKDKLIATPFLYLRARNKNREVVDLLSMKTTCSMLREDGCTYSYEERPSGGVNLVPKKNSKDICLPNKDPLSIMKGWESYQRPLGKLVKRITGLSVEEKLRQDVIQLFYDILCENFEGVMDAEIADIRGLVIHLLKVYPQEYKEAEKRYKNANKLLVKRK